MMMDKSPTINNSIHEREESFTNSIQPHHFNSSEQALNQTFINNNTNNTTNNINNQQAYKMNVIASYPQQQQASHVATSLNKDSFPKSVHSPPHYSTVAMHGNNLSLPPMQTPSSSDRSSSSPLNNFTSSLLSKPQPSMNDNQQPPANSSKSFHSTDITLGSKATNMSYEIQTGYGSLPSVQDSNMCSPTLMMQESRHHHYQQDAASVLDNKTITSNHHHVLPVVGSTPPSASLTNPSTIGQSYYNQHSQQQSDTTRMQAPHVNNNVNTNNNVAGEQTNYSNIVYRSTTNQTFADPSSNNMMMGQSNATSSLSHTRTNDYSFQNNNNNITSQQQYYQNNNSSSQYEQQHMKSALTCHMHEMLEFDLHLSNSDMRQLYSDGYYNPSLLSATTTNSTTNNSNSGSNNGSVNSSSGNTPPTTNSSPSAGVATNSSEGAILNGVSTTSTNTSLTRIDYIKCTPNGVFTNFDGKTYDSASISPGGRTSPDTSETQGLTWYENQQVVLHLWVKIKEQYLNQFKTIYDDYSSGTLNPSFISPIKFHILYKNAEYPAKEVLVHEFSLDPIQCYQKYLKTNEHEEKPAEPLLIYSRNLDFSLERKTVKVVNKRLKVRFEMVAFPYPNDMQQHSRISLLLSPTIVCLTARSFFFDKRRIKTAKGSLTGNPQPPTSATATCGGGYGGLTSSNSASSTSPIGTKLRQVAPSVMLSDTANTKSNSLICEESPSVTFSTNHRYNPYPPTNNVPTSYQQPRETRSQLSQPANNSIPQQHQQQNPYGHGNMVPLHPTEQAPSPYYTDNYNKNHQPQEAQRQPPMHSGGSSSTSPPGAGAGQHASYYSNNHAAASSSSYGTSPQQSTYRPSYSASSLIFDSTNNNQSQSHYYSSQYYTSEAVSRSSAGSPSSYPHSQQYSTPSHVKQSPVSTGSPSLPSLSAIFSNSPLNAPSNRSSPPTSINPQQQPIIKSENYPTSSSNPPPPSFSQIPSNNSNNRNQFLQLSIPVHSLPREFIDMHDSNEILVNDFLEFVNNKYRKPRSFAKLQ